QALVDLAQLRADRVALRKQLLEIRARASAHALQLLERRRVLRSLACERGESLLGFVLRLTDARNAPVELGQRAFRARLLHAQLGFLVAHALPRKLQLTEHPRR